MKKHLSPVNITMLLLITLFIVGVVSVNAQKNRGAGNAPKQKPAEKTEPAAKPTPPANVAKNQTGKKTIVVLDFDDAALSERKLEVGKQAALFLADRFSSTGNYTVVERQRILQILDEQNISQNADRYDSKLAAKIGKIFSAGGVVLGTVTEYTVKSSSKGLPGFKRVTISARIGMVVRLVDVNTAIILDSATVQGTADEKSTTTLFSDQSTIADEDLRIRLFTAAANDAVDKAMAQLEPTFAKVPETKGAAGGGNTSASPTTASGGGNAKAKVTKNAKVAQVAGKSVYISGLSDASVGDKFAVMRIGREIKDPDTGEVLDVESEKIGEVEITEVRAKVAVAKIVSGTGIKVKDVITPIE